MMVVDVAQQLNAIVGATSAALRGSYAAATASASTAYPTGAATSSQAHPRALQAKEVGAALNNGSSGVYIAFVGIIVLAFFLGMGLASKKREEKTAKKKDREIENRSKID